LELLHEVVPGVARIAVLVNPNNPGLMQDTIRQSEAALRRLGLEMLVVKAGSESEVESACCRCGAAAGQRNEHWRRRLSASAQPPDFIFRAPPRATHAVGSSRGRRGRLIDELRSQSSGRFSAGRILYRSHPKGRKPG